MGPSHIDNLARNLTNIGPRRGLVRLMDGLTISGTIAPWLGRTDARAKKRKGKSGSSGSPGPPGPPGARGPAGTGSCPNDTTFFAGAGCVENAVRAAASFATASTTCAGAGRRMMTTAELDAFR